MAAEEGEKSERGSMLKLKPEMASLATGSVNLPNSVYENHPDLILSLAKANDFENDVKPEIEVFDLAMLYNAYIDVKKELSKDLFIYNLYLEFINIPTIFKGYINF